MGALETTVPTQGVADTIRVREEAKKLSVDVLLSLFICLSMTNGNDKAVLDRLINLYYMVIPGPQV